MYRFAAGLNQISWLPAAWRSNSNPKVLQLSHDFFITKAGKAAHYAAITIV